MGCILSVDVSDQKNIDVFDKIKHVANSIVEDLSGAVSGVVENVSSIVEDLSGTLHSTVENVSNVVEDLSGVAHSAVEDLSGTLHSLSTSPVKEKNTLSKLNYSAPISIINIREKLKKHTT